MCRVHLSKYGVKIAVTKVIVSFERLKFVVRLKPLHIDDVEYEIKQALDIAVHFRCVDNSICFLRFSDEDLCTIKEKLAMEVIEYSTMQSILLKSTVHAFSSICRMPYKSVPITVW